MFQLKSNNNNQSAEYYKPVLTVPGCLEGKVDCVKP